MNHKSAFAIAIVALALIAASLTGSGVVRSASNGDDQRVVVHLSQFTNDLHAAFMAFKLADAMQAQGASVTVLVDLEGVRIADKGNPLDLRWGTNDTTLAEVYDKFVAGGGAVVLCPHCTDVAGVDRDNLRQGAMVGIPEEQTIPKLLLEADKVLDY